MSKNIVIQEGGVGKQLTANKLKTNLVGGGTCLWVPEDETQLGTKYISANGTYKASDDGLYGYSEVTVNGIGSVTGKDGDGDDATATVDPETGEIVINKLPSTIKVVTPPTVTTYADGATIDFSGMVVKGYLKSGGAWSDAAHPNGVIPISELLFPVTKADAGETRADEYTDGNGINATLISYLPTYDVMNTTHGERTRVIYLSQIVGDTIEAKTMLGTDSSGGPTQFFMTIFDNNVYVWGSTADRPLDVWKRTGTEPQFNTWMFNVIVGTSMSSGTGALKKYSDLNVNWIYYRLRYIARSSVEPTEIPELQPVDAYQIIPVAWTRPGDGSRLETSFNITVT